MKRTLLLSSFLSVALLMQFSSKAQTTELHQIQASGLKLNNTSEAHNADKAVQAAQNELLSLQKDHETNPDKHARYEAALERLKKANKQLKKHLRKDARRMAHARLGYSTGYAK